MTAPRAQLTTAAALKASVMADRLRSAVRGSDELPRERTNRGRGGLAPIGQLLQLQLPIAAAAVTPRSDVERLQLLERELGELLQVGAPSTWREYRRTVRRMVLRANRELRAR